MSRSPNQDATSEEMRSYDVGWAATNQLIRAGKSFSGRERNCAFLNLGNKRPFADISIASGLDFPDDGRGLAFSDWDHDGRVDLWMMNRTGPRLRFVKNEVQTENQFVAIKLQGEDGNGAGIGARVRLILTNDEEKNVLTKTLRAGSGYLSQSSKWLHFGLGKKEMAAIKSVEVLWPDGEREAFSGVAPNAHYVLLQGSQMAIRWEPPAVSLKGISDGAAEMPTPKEVPSRVILLKPPPLPSQLTFMDSSGQKTSFSERFEKTRFAIHLWTTWCPNCHEEMAAWTAAKESFDKAGIQVLAICVDEPGEDRDADLRKAKEKAAELKFPFEVGLANASLIENLNILQRTFIGRQSDLPLPSTILVDRSGKVSAIYKGPVMPAQLIEDAAICDADFSDILAHAIPYEGKWKTQPTGLLPRAVAVKMIASGLLDDARLYLHQLLLDLDNSPDPEAAECHRVLGAIAHEKGELDTAVTHYQKSLEIVPDQKAVHSELMRVYLSQDDIARAAGELEAILVTERNDFENLAQLGKLRKREGKNEEAIVLFRESLALRFHPETSAALADALRDQGRCDEAILHYAASLKARPRHVLTANNFAWILATHPDPDLRDGKLAKKWAKVACDETENRIPPLLGTLAAAHAEMGEFERAVELSEKAVVAAKKFGKDDLADRLTAKMKLYREREGYRDLELVR